ncbi:MAG: hypothetical protein Fur0018_27460 [Anaerolineales bacterium]
MRTDGPLLVASALAIFFLLAYAFTLAASVAEQQRILLLVLASVVYALVQYFGVTPRLRRVRFLPEISSVAHGVALAVGHVLLPPIGRLLIALGLYFSTQVYVGLGFGRRAMYLFITAFLGTLLLWPEGNLPDLFSTVGYPLFVGMISVCVGETVLHFRRLMNLQVRRMAAMNYVAHKLSSSIDRHEVVTLIGATIQKVLPADTSFVALLEGDELSLEILYDEGQIYPPMKVDREKGLAGWVLRNQRSLLLNNLPQEIQRLGIERRVVGTQRTNLSWMGTPLSFRGNVLGLVAVGSYQLYAFSQADLELLENLAFQAAQVIMNAYHHALVEAQARQDSLTRVYNHGYFLERLDAVAKISRDGAHPMSLIMLDIDYFKRYNDTYGHRMGDEVLHTLVTAMRSHIKSTDAIGRWGGEEFAILLPDTTGEQALKVARRIQDTMRNMQLHTHEGETIPAPTVSQGVAVFPWETGDIYALVDLADRRLYQAKERGRDQIVPGDDTAFGA